MSVILAAAMMASIANCAHSLSCALLYACIRKPIQIKSPCCVGGKSVLYLAAQRKGIVNTMKTVAFVPIKLNSRRLPHKNILPIAGRPLCWHLCNSLLQSKGIDEVYVYCSDETVMNYLPEGVQFKQRPKWLDGNLVKGFDIYQSFISEVDADVYVLAHTTSPFIKVASIENALAHILSGENDSAFSAERIQTFAWYQGKPINYDLNDVPRTQDMEPIWVETSAFFMFEKGIFTDHHRRIGFRPFIQEVSGIEAVDIDEKKDYELACKLAEAEGIQYE